MNQNSGIDPNLEGELFANLWRRLGCPSMAEARNNGHMLALGAELLTQQGGDPTIAEKALTAGKAMESDCLLIAEETTPPERERPIQAVSDLLTALRP